MKSIKNLKELTSVGQAYVDDDFLDSARGITIDDEHSWKEIGEFISLEVVSEVIQEIVQTANQNPHNTDGKLSRSLHKNLGLPRRYAMDNRIWHYLSCVAFPNYVRYRWTSNKGKVSKERFLGGIKRNALARLWWAAEILHTEEDYSLVKECFDYQDLYEAVFGRSMSKFPPAAQVFVRTVKDESRETIRETAKAINLLLSTFILEDLTNSQFETMIKSQIQSVSQ